MTKTILRNKTVAEIAAFESLRKVFSKPSFLTHHDETRIIYVMMDASKEFGFGGIVFH